MADIVVLGSINMDLVVKAKRAPRAGETLPGQEFHTIPGGKGANQAVAMSRLGGKVAMVGRVGSDGFGVQLIDGMTRDDVDVSQVRIDPLQPTGVALIVVEESGENRILVVAGANGQVSLQDVDFAQKLIQNARILVMQFEIPIATVEYAAELAKRNGVKVLLNSAPPYSASDSLLSKVDYLVANENEACVLSGIDVNNLQTAESAATRLQAKGPGVVILTLGAQGALLSDSDGVRHVPAFTIQPVDTTAAGDAFIGGLAVSLLERSILDESVRYANAAGALAATRLGAQTSLATRAELDRFLVERFEH